MRRAISLPNVLSYPPQHIYVDRLQNTAANFVHTDEPVPKLPHFYDVEWLHEHIHDWQIVHFHFGWEQYSLQVLQNVIATHKDSHKPIVLTVHDTRNPHSRDAKSDASYLQLLLAAADKVITLTPAAREYIRATYGKIATVIPHGPLLTPSEIQHYRTARRNIQHNDTIYVHVKNGRASLDWQRLLRMAPLIEQRTGYRIRFGISINSKPYKYCFNLLEKYQQYLIISPGLSDDDLYDRMLNMSAILLPYAWGSHSGLIELCHDLGIPSMVYDTGHYGDQNPTALLPFTVYDNSQLDHVVDAIEKLPKSYIAPSADERQALLDNFIATYKNIYATI